VGSKQSSKPTANIEGSGWGPPGGTLNWKISLEDKNLRRD